MIIDGSDVDVFANATGTGWVKIVISYDPLDDALILAYGKDERRSQSLVVDLGFSSEETALPLDEVSFSIDVVREDTYGTMPDREFSMNLKYG